MVGFPNRHLLLSGPYREAPTAFYSPTADAAGNFLPNATIRGNAGDSGTITLTDTLGQRSDYQALWLITETGAVSIDNIQIVNVTTGKTVASENVANMPSIGSGLQL
jgi:hypothetical protein